MNGRYTHLCLEKGCSWLRAAPKSVLIAGLLRYQLQTPRAYVSSERRERFHVTKVISEAMRLSYSCLLNYRHMEVTMLRGLLVICALIAFGNQAIADTRLQCRSVDSLTAYFINPTPGYDHDRYGTAPRDLMFQFESFVSSFDSDDDDSGDGSPDLLAVPHWVAYEIKRHGNGPPFSSPTPSPSRPNPWYEMEETGFLASQPGVTETAIDESYRGFGAGSGLPGLGLVNRGHLAMKSHAQRISWKAGCNTHVFVNAVPQEAHFNQGEWLSLEAYSGAAANKFGQVWVITGPIFDDPGAPDTMGLTGEIPVAVPDAMFKILVKENPNEDLPDVLAFIYPQPNNAYVKCSQADNQSHIYDHTEFLVSVLEIEQRTGLDFFRNVKFRSPVPANRAIFKDQVANDLWPVELEFYGVTCANQAP